MVKAAFLIKKPHVYVGTKKLKKGGSRLKIKREYFLLQ